MTDPFDLDPDQDVLVALAWVVQECGDSYAAGTASAIITVLQAERAAKASGGDGFRKMYPTLKPFLEDWNGELAVRVKGRLEAYLEYIDA